MAQSRNEHDLRKEPRFEMNKRASVSTSGMLWRPCLIQDLSLNGMLVMCNQAYAVNDVLKVACEIYPEKVVEFKLNVKRVSETCHGGPIMQDSDSDKAIYARYVEGLNSLKKLRSRRG